MRLLSPGEGLKAAIKADALSLIVPKIGMSLWMSIPCFRLFHRQLTPTLPVY